MAELAELETRPADPHLLTYFYFTMSKISSYIGYSNSLDIIVSYF